MIVAELIPGIILGLREGLEAFLVIGIMTKYLDKSGRAELKSAVKTGMAAGVIGSLVIGFILWSITRLLKGTGENAGKLWESTASIAGLILLSTFIYWMMKHGRTVTSEVRNQVAKQISKWGIIALAAMVVLREGVEIALFAFSSVNEGIYLIGVLGGVIAAAILAYLIFLSLVKINLTALFTITLGYLVLQAGYLFGYSIHEFLSAMKGMGRIAADSPIFIKVFNLGDTFLDHKKGPVGVVLNILIGWYSRPEWIQFILHYSYVIIMLLLWKYSRVKQAQTAEAG